MERSRVCALKKVDDRLSFADYMGTHMPHVLNPTCDMRDMRPNLPCQLAWRSMSGHVLLKEAVIYEVNTAGKPHR